MTSSTMASMSSRCSPAAHHEVELEIERLHVGDRLDPVGDLLCRTRACRCASAGPSVPASMPKVRVLIESFEQVDHFQGHLVEPEGRQMDTHARLVEAPDDFGQLGVKRDAAADDAHVSSRRRLSDRVCPTMKGVDVAGEAEGARGRAAPARLRRGACPRTRSRAR